MTPGEKDLNRARSESPLDQAKWVTPKTGFSLFSFLSGEHTTTVKPYVQTCTITMYVYSRERETKRTEREI
jgi:hypothetical protein